MVFLTTAVMTAVAAIFSLIIFYKYFKQRLDSDLYFGFALAFWTLAALFGVLIAAFGLPAYETGNESLAISLYRLSATSGTLTIYFFFVFSISFLKERAVKKYGIIFLVPMIALLFMLWFFQPVVDGEIQDSLEFTLESTYKEPFGLPVIESIIIVFLIPVLLVTYVFLYTAKIMKNCAIKIKSAAIAIGIFISTFSYIIEITDAISYVYMPIYRSLILIGLLVAFFAYLAPPRKMIVS